MDCTTGGRGYGTTYYCNFVKVPRSLRVRKEKGEPAAIALRKLQDGTIEVVAVQECRPSGLPRRAESVLQAFRPAVIRRCARSV